MAGGSPSRSLPLHADRGFVVEHGGGLVQHPDSEIHSPGLLRHGQGPRETHPELHRPLEREPDTVRLDSRARPDHQESRPEDSLT